MLPSSWPHHLSIYNIDSNWMFATLFFPVLYREELTIRMVKKYTKKWVIYNRKHCYPHILCLRTFFLPCSDYFLAPFCLVLISTWFDWDTKSCFVWVLLHVLKLEDTTTSPNTFCLLLKHHHRLLPQTRPLPRRWRLDTAGTRTPDHSCCSLPRWTPSRPSPLPCTSEGKPYA